MLTIRTDMEFKSLNPMLPEKNGVCERIRSNYDMISAQFEMEELLHMVTSPPELYLGAGGMTQLITDTTVSNSQNIKMDMVNNLMNRILLYNTNEFTYQDTVYVQTMLSKLGVMNAAQFMKQIQILQEDTRRTDNLIKFYQENMEELKNIVNAPEGERPEFLERKEQDKEKTDSIYYLQENIFKRLKTGNIYQELKNIYRNISSLKERILNNELKTAEQGRLSDYFFLEELRENISSDMSSVVFQHFNRYEMEEGDEINTETQNTQQQLTQAVLLNLADNLFVTRRDQIQGSKQFWYDTSSALYQASENTFYRFGQVQYNEQYLNEDMRSYPLQLKEEDYLQELQIEQYEEEHQEYLRQQLELINQENIKKYNMMVSSRNEESVYNSTVQSREQDIQKIGEHKQGEQEIMMEHPKQDSYDEAVTGQQEAAMEGMLTKETREIFRLARLQKENPEQFLKEQRITPMTIEQFTQEINQLTTEQGFESIYTEKQLTHKSEDILREWVEEPLRHIDRRMQQAEQTTENIRFIHKQTENTIGEDAVEELYQQNRILLQKTETLEHKVETETITKTEVNNINHQIVNNQVMEMDQMVQAGMQRQLNQISDQVYRRLEQRLENERKRRGY